MIEKLQSNQTVIWSGLPVKRGECSVYNAQSHFIKNPRLEIIDFQIEEDGISCISWLDNVLKGTLVNPTCLSLH